MELSAVTEVQKQEVAGFAQAINENLRSSTGGGAEVAFGLSCGLGLIPVVGIILSLLIFKIVSLIPALFFLVIALLGLVGISMVLANIARNNRQKRLYQTEVEPEIVQFLSKQHLSRQDFDTLASQALPPDAPLQAFLSPIYIGDLDQSERANPSED